MKNRHSLCLRGRPEPDFRLGFMRQIRSSILLGIPLLVKGQTRTNIEFVSQSERKQVGKKSCIRISFAAMQLNRRIFLEKSDYNFFYYYFLKANVLNGKIHDVSITSFL